MTIPAIGPDNYRVNLTVRPGTRLALSAPRPHSSHGRAQGARPPRPAGDAGRWPERMEVPMNRIGIRTVPLLLATMLLGSFSVALSGEPVVPPTKYYEGSIPGVLAYRLSTNGRASYTAGARILITLTLTNLSADPIEVCSDCVGASIQVTSQATGSFCAMTSDRDFNPSTPKSRLEPHAEVSKVIDISNLSCVRTGSGRFELNDAYCFRRQELGKKTVDYCVRAPTTVIEIAR